MIINGDFPHNPEPLAENLKDLSDLVVKEHADFGIELFQLIQELDDYEDDQHALEMSVEAK